MPVDDDFGFGGEDVAVKEEPVEQDFSFAPPGGWPVPTSSRLWCLCCLYRAAPSGHARGDQLRGIAKSLLAHCQTSQV